jgi:uncharacterized membrane protein
MRQDALMAHQLARGRRGVPPTVVIMVVTLLSILLGFAQKYPCNNGHPGPGVLWRQSCYTDLLPLYSGRGLNDGDLPYLDHDVEYPVLTGGLMAAVGLPVHSLGKSGALLRAARAVGFETVDEGVVFYWGTAVVLGCLAMLTSWALLACRRERPWDVLMWAVSPGLILAATVNWDLLAVSLTTVAILAWARGRPGWAGALLGLGAAAKFYPLLVLGPLIMLCLRQRTFRTARAASITVAAAVVAWGVVNLPIALVAPHGWAEYYRFSTRRWIDWGSLWFILDQSTHQRFGGGLVHALSGDVAALNLSSWLLFVVCCAGIGVLIWFAPRTPRVASTAFLVVAAFLLTNKVWSPQFVLWLIPLAVLARPRWGFFLIWQGVEIGYLMSVFRVTLGGPGDGFALEQASVARWLCVAVMAGLVVKETLHPELDVVRAGDPAGSDGDPDAGVLIETAFEPDDALSVARAGAS